MIMMIMMMMMMMMMMTMMMTMTTTTTTTTTHLHDVHDALARAHLVRRQRGRVCVFRRSATRHACAWTNSVVSWLGYHAKKCHTLPQVGLPLAASQCVTKKSPLHMRSSRMLLKPRERGSRGGAEEGDEGGRVRACAA